MTRDPGQRLSMVFFCENIFRNFFEEVTALFGSAYRPFKVSFDRPQGQVTAQAVSNGPESVTLSNWPQCMQHAVTGSPAVCCIKAVMMDFISGGSGRVDWVTRRSHSASISSYVASIIINDEEPKPCRLHAQLRYVTREALDWFRTFSEFFGH